MSPSSPNILIVGPSWVGDMVMAQSLFMALRQNQPNCTIDVLAPGWSLPLLARMPEVRQGIAMPLGHGRLALTERHALGRNLRQAAYARAIVLPNSWKSAIVPWAANIPQRSGYIGEWRWGLLNDARRLDKTHLTMTVQRFVALASEQSASETANLGYPLPRLVIRTEQQQAVIAKFALDVGTPVLALCPGAEYGPAKRWPAHHFAEVARHIHQRGWQVWLFGSDKDQAVADEINDLSNGLCRNFAGATQLAEAVDLLSLCRAVVSNDSGLMHVAAALDKKVIAVYGSSDPGFTPPLHPDAEVINLKLACSPCFKRQCPLGTTACLSGIEPGRVIDAINR
ncbi:MAG: lipopolysaccharide heptosyltransferase II [Methylomonas sp.]|nr:lipopolysaccharide heptosyltransferase II [Methylomonas sp.]PPD19679.1 MAG: lipopolysaccharide heptosyltransferase II [Methylomonas sp.]PPD25824.1 MAG: lipopolysaccharide heptosyltransferase II [Methylomonas sp.]PPD37283.1 MAG: lipopolysaccharide heptosyltransferase II [Methylomonas sp.]PPD39049.1 MAG: lipopolysaccharide heptosyltransferase II [Methylomonas sp.]